MQCINDRHDSCGSHRPKEKMVPVFLHRGLLPLVSTVCSLCAGLYPVPGAVQAGAHLSKEFFELVKAIGESKSKQVRGAVSQLAASSVAGPPSRTARRCPPARVSLHCKRISVCMSFPRRPMRRPACSCVARRGFLVVSPPTTPSAHRSSHAGPRCRWNSPPPFLVPTPTLIYCPGASSLPVMAC